MKALLVCLILLSTKAFSYYGDATNYNSVDSFAATRQQDFSTIQEFAVALTSPFPQPKMKVRAIYSWLLTHVKPSYTGYDQPDLSFAMNTLKYRQAACAGFSELLQEALMAVGIKAELVMGKVNKEQPESMLHHEYVIVWLKGIPFVVDPTWGIIDRENYFLLPMTSAIFSYFPHEAAQQYLKIPLNQTDWLKLPRRASPRPRTCKKGAVVYSSLSRNIAAGCLPVVTTLSILGWSADGHTAIVKYKGGLGFIAKDDILTLDY